MLNITREELRDEIRNNVLEIVTTVVTESSRSLRIMLSEDMVAVSDHVDSLERRMTKGFKDVDRRFENLEREVKAINQNLTTHVNDSRAHTRLAA
jgi:phosphate uptake regulator